MPEQHLAPVDPIGNCEFIHGLLERCLAPALCYLCGLLHNIGKVVALGTIHELARDSANN
jgi:HD-like signal output (HDOD) protein